MSARPNHTPLKYVAELRRLYEQLAMQIAALEKDFPAASRQVQAVRAIVTKIRNTYPRRLAAGHLVDRGSPCGLRDVDGLSVRLNSDDTVSLLIVEVKQEREGDSGLGPLRLLARCPVRDVRVVLLRTRSMGGNEAGEEPQPIDAEDMATGKKIETSTKCPINTPGRLRWLIRDWWHDSSDDTT